MPRFVWTQDMRRSIFRRLLSDFGTYSGWIPGRRGGDPLSPTGRDVEFEASLRDLAVQFGRDSAQWTAIRQQVRWGLTRQARVTHQNHFKIMVMNKAAALEVGFLSYRDMPTDADLAFDATSHDEGETEDE